MAIIVPFCKLVIDDMGDRSYYSNTKGVDNTLFNWSILNHSVHNSKEEQVNMPNNDDAKNICAYCELLFIEI